MWVTPRLRLSHGHQIESLEQRMLLTGAGDLDTDFNHSGQATYSIPGVDSLTIKDVAVQGDGKIVEVGTDSAGAAVVLRLNVDGSLDTSFNSTGFHRFLFNIGAPSRGVAVAIQAGGNILVAGDRIDTDVKFRKMALARFTSSGSFDSSFATSGIYLDQFTVSASAMVIQNGFDQDPTNDGIVLVGTGLPLVFPDNDNLFAIRVTSAGDRDLTFSGRVDFGGDDDAFAATLDLSSGPRFQDIVIVGITDIGGSGQQMAIARLNAADGSADDSFSGDGKLAVPLFLAQSSIARSVLVQSDGKIVVGGGFTTVGFEQMGLIRLNTDGSFDKTFGPSNNAEVALNADSPEEAEDMVFSQSGDLIISGIGASGTVVSCLTSSGMLDPVFSGGGQDAIHSTGLSGVALARSQKGTLIVGGGDNATTTKIYDRGLATVSITSFDTSASEQGPDQASFEVFQRETRNLDTDVLFSVSGSAMAPGSIQKTQIDYTGISDSVLGRLADITPGENTAIIFITPIDDTRGEPDETAIFTLEDDPGVYDIVSPSTITLTIHDNDQAVTGNIFDDASLNGSLDSSTEAGMGGVEVYLDANGNSKIDSGELTTTTSTSGNFLFTSVPAGSYTLRQILPSGFAQEVPAGNAGMAINMAANLSFSGKTFADKPTTTDPTSVVLQGENATLAGGTVAAHANAGFTGTGYADFGGIGSSLTWTFNRFLSATIPLVIRYANGSTANRPFSVVINGGAPVILGGAPTGAWTTWKTVNAFGTLKAGTNTIAITATDNSGGVNVDSLTINTSIANNGPATYQAENAALAGGTVASSANSGFTGTGYADFGGQNSSAQWTVNQSVATPVMLVFRYANGGTANRPLSISVNGTTVGTIACAPTGSWTTWSTVSISANLIAGNNTIKAVASTSAGGANVDSLTVNPVTIYQAESATLAGGTVAKADNAGFTGSGYADFGSTGSSVAFTVTGSGTSQTLAFRYANGSAANRPVSISLNGTLIATVAFASTGSWTTWTTISFNTILLSGNNTIKLSVTGSDGPNLDWLSVG